MTGIWDNRRLEGKALPEEKDPQLLIAVKQKEGQKQKAHGRNRRTSVKLKRRWGENSELQEAQRERLVFRLLKNRLFGNTGGW